MLAHFDVVEDDYNIRCRDAHGNDASQTHPTEVASWECLDGDDDFTTLDAVDTTCGCSTSTPTATPAPTTGLEQTPAPLLESAAPIAPTPASVEPEPPTVSSSSTSSTSLGPVIGGSVGAVALLLIAGVFAAKRRRDGKRSGHSDGPPSGAGDAPAGSGGAGRNYPIVSEFGGTNLPAV